MKANDLRQLIREVITEEIGQPTPQQIIPDDEEELWKIFQSVPENHTLLFGSFLPKWSALLTIFHGQNEVWGASAMHPHFGPVDGKWRKGGDVNLSILLRHLCTEIYNYGENNDVYYSMVKTVPKS